MARAHPDVAVSGSGGPSSLAPAGGHVHRCCSLVRAVLDPARSAQPAADLAWGVGPGRTGVVLQLHGADAAGQHRVDRRLGCLLPHHPTCWYPLLSDPHTPLVLLPLWLVMGLALLSPPWVLLLTLFIFPMSLLLLRWFITFFPFVNLQLTILVPSSLILPASTTLV